MSDVTKLSGYAVTETVGDAVSKVSVYAVVEDEGLPPLTPKRRRTVSVTIMD